MQFLPLITIEPLLRSVPERKQYGNIFWERCIEMMKSIYVGNLPFGTTEAEVRGLFKDYGTVEAVRMIADRDTGRLKGFGFVELESADANKAIMDLDGKDFGGRSLKVNEARERQDGPQRRSW
jgi:RNA recognition motif-containing protein